MVRCDFSRSAILFGWLFVHDDAHVALAFITPIIDVAKSTAFSSSSLDATRLVWLTGHEDLRLRDHGGFTNALREATNSGDDDGNVVVPVFVLDPKIHLRSKSEAVITRLHNCLVSLEKAIESSSTSSLIEPLVVRSGAASWVLPSLAKELDAVSCHVIDDDVISDMRDSQRLTRSSLTEMGVKVQRWTNALRPSAPWVSGEERKTGLMPSFYPDYCKIVDELPIAAVQKDNIIETATVGDEQVKIPSEGVPSVLELLKMSQSVTPPAVLQHRSTYPNTEPYKQIISDRWTTEKGAQRALKEYCRVGKASFADKHFISSDAVGGKRSKYAAAASRIAKGSRCPSDTLALREAPTRAFSSALTLGSLSARDVVDAARNRHPTTPPLWVGDGIGGVNTSYLNNVPLWGRSSEGSLSDVIEWREWFRLLAERSLELQEKGEPATSGGEKAMAGDPREAGTINYWRWTQHLVRYLSWPSGKDYDPNRHAPAILLVHGFAASAEQWERLVYRLREQMGDTIPPIYAVDLLGFGHSEKPGLSYTQYLWEAQLVDFAVEVMEAVPMVMIGNSIGGGLSAGAAASLGKDICKGIVLCNTAGTLQDPDTYAGYTYEKREGATQINAIRSYTEAAMEGNPNEAPYRPVPIVGNNSLDLFGTGIIKFLYPQIEKRLSLIFGNRMENADPAAVYAIQQAAQHPGSANVIGSGQKLSPNRPLNEVLAGFDVLVVQGLDDQVSSPQVAKYRAELFARLNPGKVVVDSIANAGHCPHDERPDLVASSICKWFSKRTALPSLKDDATTGAELTKRILNQMQEEGVAVL